jgi:hypothetical protein
MATEPTKEQIEAIENLSTKEQNLIKKYMKNPLSLSSEEEESFKKVNPVALESLKRISLEGVLTGATAGSSFGPWGAVAGGVLGGLFGGGGSESAENVETRAPAPRDADQQILWDDFMTSIYGYDPTPSNATLGKFLADNPDIESNLNKTFLDENPELAESIGLGGKRDKITGGGQFGGFDRPTIPGVPGTGDFVGDSPPAGGPTYSPIEPGFLENISGVQPGEGPPDNQAAGNPINIVEDKPKPAIPNSQQYSQEVLDAYIEGTRGKSLLDRLTEDIASNKASDLTALASILDLNTTQLADMEKQAGILKTADQLYGNQMGFAGDALKRSATDTTNRYLGETGGLLDTFRPVANRGPVNVSLGNFSAPITTGSQRDAANRVSNLAEGQRSRSSALSDLIYGTDTSQAGLGRDITGQGVAYDQEISKIARQYGVDYAQAKNILEKTYTPNLAQEQKDTFMEKLIADQENRRYGIPSTTSSATYAPGPNWLENISQGLSMKKGLDDLFNGLNAGDA